MTITAVVMKMLSAVRQAHCPELIEGLRELYQASTLCRIWHRICESKHLGGAVDKPHHWHAVKVVDDIEAAVCLVKAREMR